MIRVSSDSSALLAAGRERVLADQPPIFEFSHKSQGTPEKTLIQLAIHNEQLRSEIVHYARLGYYVYKQSDDITSFVADWNIPKLWHSVSNGKFQLSAGGLIHSYEPSELEEGSMTRHLLVIFSSIGASPFGASLMRYFEQNFKSVKKYIPQNFSVLRIADLDGVVGGFYLDTCRNPRRGAEIQDLIAEIAGSQGIPRENVILYGGSKGATGSLFHGLSGGYDFIAVDPVINDEYYEKKFLDTHFTGSGIFPKTKELVFEELGRKVRSTSSVNELGFIVTSPGSEQYPYIRHFLEDGLTQRISVIESHHPMIKDHPGVSERTLHLVTSLITLHSLKWSVEKKTTVVHA